MVPSFSEPELQLDGPRPPAWFAFDETRPLAVFAGISSPWTSVRKVREGETTNDLLGFLTTEPTAEAGALHPKAMPVILRTSEGIEIWMTAPTAEALTLQTRLPDRSLTIAVCGKEDDRSAPSYDTPVSATRDGSDRP